MPHEINNHIDPDGYFLRESVANPGSFPPSDATRIPRIGAGPDQIDRFDRASETWSVETTHKGQMAWEKTTANPRQITTHGPLSDLLTYLEPPVDFPLWDAAAGAWIVDEAAKTEALKASVRAERDTRIERVRWRIERNQSEVRAGLTPTEDIANLDTYVQALRDIPQQAGFPNSVEWPEKPAT